MTIYYQLTEPEVIGGLIRIRYRPTDNRLAWIIVGIAGWLMFVHGIYIRSAWAKTYSMIGWGMFCFSLVMILLVPFYVRRAITQHVRSNRELYTSSQEMTFSEKGLSYSSPDLKQSIAWKNFRNFAQDDHYFYLYSGRSGLFSILPKRAFDEACLDAFLHLAQSLQTE